MKVEPVTPTRADVEKLKQSWLADPCWDIEDTEGFEDYRDELELFSDIQGMKWADERMEYLKNKYGSAMEHADLIGVIERMERRIVQLEKQIERLEAR